MNVPTMLSELNDHGFTDETNDRKLATLQASVWEVEGLHPWPWLETHVNLTFDGTTGVPSNWATDAAYFRASIRARDLTHGRRIFPIALEAWEDQYAELIDEGEPSLYYFEGRDLHVWPTPTAGTVIRLRFIKWSSELALDTAESGILIPKYFHRGLIVNGALSALYDMEDDSELAVRFDNRQAKALAFAQEAMFKRQYDSPDNITATDPDDWDRYGF